MKRKKALAAVLALGMLGGGGYGVYHHFFGAAQGSADRVSSDKEDAVYVDQVSVITGYGSGNGLIERYGGEVEPQAVLEVKLESERKVDECFVKEGDEVREGQRLFAYDTQEDEDKLAQAEIEIERAQGEIEISQKAIEQNEKDIRSAGADDQLTYRTYILQEQNNIKQKEYEIKTKELEIEQLKENIADSVVTAEMAGIVQKINDSGASDSFSYSGGEESSAYITILAAGDFRIKGTINEQNLNSGLIYEGMEMLVHSRVNDEQTWKGSITEINTDQKEEESNNNNYYYEASGSSNYSFYVELESSEGLILGQHVYMEENVGQSDQKEGLWLEEYYVMQEDGKAYVWAASEANVLEKREVTLGEFDEELQKYEIKEGLAADDYICYPSEGAAEGTPVIYNDFSSNVSEEGYSGEDLYGEGMDWEDEEVNDLDAESGMNEYSDEEFYDDGEAYDDAEVFDADAEFYDDAEVLDDGAEFYDDAEVLDDGAEFYDDAESFDDEAEVEEE